MYVVQIEEVTSVVQSKKQVLCKVRNLKLCLKLGGKP